EFLLDIRTDGRIADVGVDFAFGCNADTHRLEVGVIDIGWNNKPAASHLRADLLGRQIFPPRDVVHLLSDDALAGVMQLRANAMVVTFGYPLCAHIGSLLKQQKSGVRSQKTEFTIPGSNC